MRYFQEGKKRESSAVERKLLNANISNEDASRNRL